MYIPLSGKTILIILFVLALTVFTVEPAHAANCVWSGIIDTSWETPGNWIGCNGVTPAINDTVTIPNVNNDPVLSTTLTIAGLTVNIGGILTINDGNTLSVVGSVTIQGTLTGAGDVEVDGAMSWSAGTLSGSGTTTILSGSTLTISGSSKILDGRSLLNAGAVSWIGPTQIVGQNGAVLHNLAGATFDLQSDAAFNSGPGGATFYNDGTLIKSANSSTSNISALFHNSGTVEVQSGTLGLINSSNNSGSFSVLAGTTLRFEGNTHTLTASSDVSGAGNVTATGTAVVQLDGSYSVSGLTTISGGTVEINNPLNIANLTISSGILQGSGTVTITSSFNWTGGTMAGTGITHIPAGTTFTISGVSKVLDGRILNNSSQANWGGTTQITAQGGAVINNLPGGVFDSQADNTINVGSGGATFNNQATFVKSAGTSSTNLNIPFNNSGTLLVQSGILQLGASSEHSGSLQVNSATTLRFDGDAHTLLNSATLFGNGTVLIMAGSTLTNLSNAYNVTATTLNAGTAHFVTAATLPVLTLSSGVFIADAPVLISGQFNWSGGTVTGGAVVEVSNSASLTISGVAKTLDGVLLTHLGSGNWTAATQILATNGALFHNMGTLNLQSDASFTAGSGGGAFQNDGVFVKSSGSGTANMNAPMTNNGLIEVTSGTLQFNYDSSTSGTLTPSGAGTVRFNNNTHTFAVGSVMSGDGALAIGNGPATVVVSGTVVISGTTSVSGGTAVFHTPATLGTLNLSGGQLQGQSVIQINNAFNWSGGILSGTGNTEVLSAALLTLSGASKILDKHTLVHAGTGSWSGGTIQAAAGAVFHTLPGATLDIQSDTTFSSGSGSGTFLNEGVINKSAGNTYTTFAVPLHNSGEVTIYTSTLRFNGGGESSGTINGAGGVIFSGSETTFTVNGSYDVGGTAVSNGTVLFQQPANVPNLVLSGGTISGTGFITVTQNFLWSGGVLGGQGTVLVSDGTVFQLSGSEKTLNGRLLLNQGQATWQNNSTLTGLNGAAFHNLPPAHFATANYIITFNTPLSNSGTIEITGGTLEVNQSLYSDGHIIGDGNLTVGMTTTAVLSGTYALTGTTRLTGDDVMFSGPGGAVLGHLIQENGNLTLANMDVTVLGDWIHENGDFFANQSQVIFAGQTVQNLTLLLPTPFAHVTVGAGTVLLETEEANHATVLGSLTNLGTIRKILEINEAGMYEFGLTAVSMNIVSPGRLNDIQVDRIDENHPAADDNTQAGRYWQIMADGNSYMVHLILPHQITPPKDAQVCRFLDPGWFCSRTGYSDNTVTLAGVTAFSDWTIGDGPMYDYYLPLILQEDDR